mmetsp:Transcript_6013/g.15280  ORF Transcript_6013/g.15280 Transcript_6013/m.15280 type:complete len:221 (+) Transcript_6013:810-1472(+)
MRFDAVDTSLSSSENLIVILPSPPGTSSLKTSAKFFATPLNVRSSASSFLASRCSIRAVIASSPFTISFSRSKSLWRWSEKLTYWSCAFLFTWPNCSSWRLQSAFSAISCSLDLLVNDWSNPPLGIAPNLRMQSVASSCLRCNCDRLDSSLSSSLASSCCLEISAASSARSFSSDAAKSRSSLFLLSCWLAKSACAFSAPDRRLRNSSNRVAALPPRSGL